MILTLEEEKAMHTNKEAKKPHVLLIMQMDFGENMRVFLQ